MVRSCGPAVPPAQNPGVLLGTALGAAALDAGRDKVTIIASPGIDTFGAWAEQLIAESTGKEGKGLIPIDGEPVDVPAVYGRDRFFVYLRLDSRADPRQDEAVRSLEREGHPVAHITLANEEQLPQEFFRFEIATAVAGAMLGINPFDQPDVEASKIETKKLFDAAEKSGALPSETPVFADDTIALYADARNAGSLSRASDGWRRPLPRISPCQGRRLRGPARLRLAQPGPSRDPAGGPRGASRQAAPRNLPRVRAALPALHRTGLQGRPRHRRVPPYHRRPVRRSGDSRPQPRLRHGGGRPGAGRLFGAAERERRALRVHIKGGQIEAGLKRIAAAIKAAL